MTVNQMLCPDCGGLLVLAISLDEKAGSRSDEKTGVITSWWTTIENWECCYCGVDYWIVDHWEMEQTS